VEHKIFNFIGIASLVVLGLGWLYKPTSVWAQYYGGNEVKRSIVIDKKLRPIKDVKFYDNLDRGQKIFVEGNFIDFNIVIENSGSEKLSQVEVKDILPKYLELVFYPGTYDKDTNVITWNFYDFNPGDSKTYLIRARIKNLPVGENGKTIFKMVNRSEVRSGDLFDSDTASYYVETKTTPSTGSEGLILQTILLATTAVGALGVRKLARGY
jgi:uncharacterized repeat protein (TIGR01451 family)